MLMPTLLNFLASWLCFHYIFPISEAIDFQFDSTTSVRYSSYVEHQFSYLEVPKQTETRVREFADCAMGCLMKSPPCLSVNMASTSDGDGMFWCELLLADMYNNSQSFKENNSTSHHYSIWTPCLKKPCQNGGLCVPVYRDNTHRCLCKTGFTGKNCETNINDCSPNPCVNGGTCIDGVNGYNCTCTVGYYGKNCSTNHDDCSPNPCVNGATCTDGLDDYSCACAVGYEGKNCSINHDDCSPNPCANGATCTDGLNHYSCACEVGYVGRNCSVTCNQNDGWKTFNSHCYKYFGAQKTWSNAKTYCQNLGSYLLTAHSQAERDFALSLYPAGTRVWMGGNDIAANGAWIWEDGKPWGVYTAWISGEPNGGDSESCLEMFKSGSYHGLWNDVSCRTSRTFICKK